MENQVQRMLSAADYLIFGLMLLISLAIGVIYAVRDRKSKEGTEGYLMAGRSMTAVPVGISLAVSFQSSVTILGIPNDIFVYGVTYAWSLASLWLTFPVVIFVIIPTVYHLGISSAYEYLGQRYNKLMRLTATSFYLLSNLLYMGVNIYGPALTLSTVAGLPIHTAMLSTGIVCILYTSMGGLRGVIWADVVQGIFMTAGMLAVIIRGSILNGGIFEVWRIAESNGRTSSNYSSDPQIRYTFASTLVGAFVIWTGIFGTNQSQIQRMMCVKSQKESFKAMGVAVIGICISTILACCCGIVSYTLFSECDPLMAECIDRADEIYAFGVFNIFHDIPGLNGLFLACVFSASLSTVSSGLNSMSTVIMADFIKPHTKWGERVNTWVARGTTLLLGCSALGLGLLASAVGDIVKLAVVAIAAFTSPCLAVFMLGIWCSFTNAKGALSGLITGFATSCFLLFGSTSLRRTKVGQLETSTTRCPVNCDFNPLQNTTYVSIQRANDSLPAIDRELHGIENLYALSFYYIGLLVFIVAVIVTVAVSLLTGGWKARFDVKHHLIRPPFQSRIFHCIPERIRSCLRCGIDWSDESARNAVIANDNKREMDPLTALDRKTTSENI